VVSECRDLKGIDFSVVAAHRLERPSN
jgi:hypothetical protein